MKTLDAKCLLAMRWTAAAAIVVAFMAVWSPDATASPQRWSCDCTISPDAPAKKCTCPGPYEYYIARSGTKRFWAACNFRTSNSSVISVEAKLEVIYKNSHVTCTTNNYPAFGEVYTKRSCTNWGGKRKNVVRFRILCGNCGVHDLCPPEYVNF